MKHEMVIVPFIENLEYHRCAKCNEWGNTVHRKKYFIHKETGVGYIKVNCTKCGYTFAMETADHAG
jgi:hypothetical protein